MVRVTVFGSSSKKTPTKFLEAAFALGALLAEQGHICVNGGGDCGVMGELNKGVRSKGGEIIGVIHERFTVDTSEDRLIKNMIITTGDDLTSRKQFLLDHGDCVLVMPGGVGTFDELWDAVCGKSLGMKGMKMKPICIVNVDGYFEGSIMQLKRAFDEDLLYLRLEDYLHVEASPAESLGWCVRTLEQSKGDSMDPALSQVGREDRIAHRVVAGAEKL